MSCHPTFSGRSQIAVLALTANVWIFDPPLNMSHIDYRPISGYMGI